VVRGRLVRRRKGVDEVRETKSLPGSQSDATGMLSCRSRSWVRGYEAGRQAGRLGGRSDAAVGRRRACSEEVLLCRRGSAIMKENRTVGCLQTRTDTDRQARAGRGGVLERVMGEESVREDRPGQRQASRTSEASVDP
jgi:hypothetical protein